MKRSMGQSALSAAAAAICALLAVSPASAVETRGQGGQETDQSALASPWSFQLMPYVWASGFSGTVRPFTGAPTFAVSKSFSETLKDLDAAFFLAGGAQRGRFVALGDFSHVAMSRSGSVAPGVPAEAATRQTTLTLAGGYKIFKGQRSSIDVFAGMRAFWLEADVAVAGGALSVSPQQSFVDPLFGARASAMLAPRWSGVLYTDVGGFGAGSELTVVASAMLNYHATRRITVSGGYRSMWLDYDDRGTLADVNIGGPLIGVSFRF